MNVAALYKYLRVVDVVDAMDGIGYFDIGLLDPEIRPLWLGMRFWGPAATVRCVPSNRPFLRLYWNRFIYSEKLKRRGTILHGLPLWNLRKDCRHRQCGIWHVFVQVYLSESAGSMN